MSAPQDQPLDVRPMSRVLLVLVGAALVVAGVSWVLLNANNVPAFHDAGGLLGVAVFGGFPGLTGIGIGLFLIRLAAARYPGSI